MIVGLHVDVFLVLLNSKLVDLYNKLSCPLGKYSDNFFKSSDLLRRSSEADNVFSMSYFLRSAKFGTLLSRHSVKHGNIEGCEGTYHACLFCYRQL
jgi:hypothetical protein